MDGLEEWTRRVKHLVEGFGQVLPAVNAVRDPDRVGSTVSGSIRRGAGPIPGDHADARRRRPPSGHRLGLPIGQKGEGSMPLEITHDGPRGPTLPHGPVVDTKPPGGGHIREGHTTPQAQEGGATDGEAQATASAGPGRARPRHGDVHEPLHEPRRASSPRRDQRSQPLGQDAPGAAAIGAEDRSHLQVEHNAPWAPRPIQHPAALATLDPPRRKPAERTMHQGLGRGQLQRELGGGVVHVPGVEVEEGSIGQPTSQKCHR